MNQIFEKLNPEQFEAATHMDGPLLIIAGAGSGKTHTLISRVIHLVENGVKPESILLLTFTNKAADEMKSRAISASDDRCGNIVACTYHSFCAAMLRQYAYAIGYKPNYTILSSSEVVDAIQFVKAKEGERFKRFKGFPPAKAIAAIISGATNKLMTIAAYMEAENSKYMSFTHEVGAIAELYAAHKKSRNLMDYDDLLVLFAELLETSEKARSSISNTYKYIMVDEYQDTNAIQEKIIMSLRQDNRNLAVVGDDAQSIYAFRGSDVNIILNFANKMPGCKTVTLRTNYRSNDEIVQLSNASINLHKAKGFDKNMVGTYEAGRSPVMLRPENDGDEAVTVLDLISRFHIQGIPYQDMAVLARSSFTMYRLEGLLAEKNMAYEKVGGMKFLEHTCIVDVLAYLRCLTNPSDQLAWFRILKLLPHIGDIYAGRISEDCIEDRGFLFNSTHIKKSFATELMYLATQMERFEPMDFKSQLDSVISFYVKLRKRCIELADVEDEASRTEMWAKLEEDKQVLDMLPVITAKYKTAAAFLDAITLDAAASPNSGGDDPLTLSTIHSAKGLEWKVVFVLGCVEGVFPKECEEGSNADDEELRCFYVAITRAKEHLYISCPESTRLKGRYLYGQPTHYLNGCEDLLRMA